MITRDDITKLAELSRIKLADDEQEALRTQIGSILGYIDQLKKAAQVSVAKPEVGELFNVMREDTNPHKSGEFTEKILASAPARDENYLKVKKIL